MNVETVDLSARGVELPSDRVGIVLPQPYLELTSAEPFRCQAAAKDRQLAILSETLNVARQAPHNVSRTHFTVFPEYSIPGLDGIALVDDTVGAAEWPNGAIVIGGTDGLSKEDFVRLVETPNTHYDSDPNLIRSSEWVNCCITWIKNTHGSVERWLQPKLCPAGPERNTACQHMYRGNSAYVFRGSKNDGTQYRFATLVCFDWIASVAGQKVWQWVLSDLEKQAAQVVAELSLSWLFVIQHNRKPSDDTFLREVPDFFDQTKFPRVHRHHTCLVFANTAGRDTPGPADLYGCSSLVFTRQTLFKDPTCYSTYSNGSKRFRSSTLLSSYRDVLFRERGACIHAFAQMIPNSLRAGPAGTTFAIDYPFVFPLNGTRDPRAPADHVPASVKWLNDRLDELPSLGDRYGTAALADQINTVHRRSIAGLRVVSAQIAGDAIRLGAGGSDAKHADDWDRVEVEAIEHLVCTLDILGLGFPNPDIGASPAHAAVVMKGHLVDLIAIRGDSHEACIAHLRNCLPALRRQTLLISRERDNIPWRKRFGSFLEQRTPRLGQERKFTDPYGAMLQIGYERLLGTFLEAKTPDGLRDTMNAELDA